MVVGVGAVVADAGHVGLPSHLHHAGEGRPVGGRDEPGGVRGDRFDSG